MKRKESALADSSFYFGSGYAILFEIEEKEQELKYDYKYVKFAGKESGSAEEKIEGEKTAACLCGGGNPHVQGSSG